MSARQFSSRWFRVYDEAIDDPKIQRLTDRQHRFLVNCWCLASKHDGILPPIPEIAWRIRKTESAVIAMISELSERGLIDSASGELTPHNWGERQFQSDFSKERVQRYRDRVRSNGAKVGGYLKHKADVFDRDGGRCVYCGSTEKLVLDHMVPVIAGGDDDPSNLCCCCKKCNSGKAGRTPEQAGMKFLATVTEDLYRQNLSRLLPRRVTACHRDSNGPRADTEQIQSRSEQERDTPPLDAIGEAAQRMYSRHPKKKNMVLVPGALQGAMKRGHNLIDIEACHAAWCDSFDWTKDGGRWAPKLDEWIADLGFTRWPAGHSKSPSPIGTKYVTGDYDENGNWVEGR